MPRSRFWQELTTRDFAEGSPAEWIAVQPLAAVEQHGPHLPLVTDAAIAEGMLARALELMPSNLPTIFLPLQSLGKSDEHISSPGTLTLSYGTLAALLSEIGDSVHRAGVKKLILVNAHGGNVPVMDIVARELRVRHDMLCVTTGWSRFGTPPGLFSAQELSLGIHGGEVETSLMLHLCPDLVRMDLAKDFPSNQSDFVKEFKHLRAHGPAQFGWKAQDLNPQGAVGNAAGASAAKGKAVIDHQAHAFVELCADVHAFDPARLWSR